MGIDLNITENERYERIYQKHQLEIIRLKDKGFSEEDIIEMLCLHKNVYKALLLHTPIC